MITYTKQQKCRKRTNKKVKEITVKNGGYILYSYVHRLIGNNEI